MHNSVYMLFFNKAERGNEISMRVNFLRSAPDKSGIASRLRRQWLSNGEHSVPCSANCHSRAAKKLLRCLDPSCQVKADSQAGCDWVELTAIPGSMSNSGRGTQHSQRKYSHACRTLSQVSCLCNSSLASCTLGRSNGSCEPLWHACGSSHFDTMSNDHSCAYHGLVVDEHGAPAKIPRSF